MSRTVTVRGVPPELHRNLTSRAAASRRSLAQEAVVELEPVARGSNESVHEQARALRERLAGLGVRLDPERVEQSIRGGRR